MHRLLMTLVLVSFGMQALLAQSYQVLKDDPDRLINGHLAFEYLTVDAGFGNTSGAFAWALGLNGYYPLLPSLGIEASVRTPILKLESSSGLAIGAEAGVSKTLFSKTRRKEEMKVLVGFSQSRSFFGDRVTTSTTTLTMPGNLKSQVFVRGGGYYRHSAFAFDLPNGFSQFSSITHSGVYVGLGFFKGKFFQFRGGSSGKEFALGNIFRFYADLLILPTQVEDPTFDDSDSLGWRIGVKWYNAPFTVADNFGEKKGFFGNMFAIVELGTRPYEGTVVTASVGYIFKKF